MGFGEYTCDRCKGTFERGRSREEAIAEAHEEFPTLDAHPQIEVCDECYQIIMANFAAESRRN